MIVVNNLSSKYIKFDIQIEISLLILISCFNCIENEKV